MNPMDIERQLMPLRDFEETAKQLYQDNPQAYEQVVQSWEEFVQRYRETKDVPLQDLSLIHI